jgi:hypothetical protein
MEDGYEELIEFWLLLALKHAFEQLINVINLNNNNNNIKKNNINFTDVFFFFLTDKIQHNKIVNK